MKKIYDVLIIGAGPAGALCGALLAKAGRTVLIIEAQKELKRKVCGEYLCPLGVDLLHKLDLYQTISDFSDVHGMNIHSPKGQLVQTLFPQTKIDSNSTKNNYGKSLNRKIFDERLLEFAKKSGADIVMGESVKSFQYNGSSWDIETVQGTTYSTRLLIGADGRRSHVAKFIGASSKEHKDDNKRVALHVWVQSKIHVNNVGQMHLYSDSSYIGVDPTGDNEYNVSLVCDASKIKEYGGVLSTINHYIKNSPALFKQIGHVSEDQQVYTVSPITHKTKKYNYPNVALIGDAAGFIDPLTGEGIFNALWMANQLAEKIIQLKPSFKYKKAITAYNLTREKFFFQKKMTNLFFQKLIRMPILVEIIAKHLNRKKERANAFVGIIGNVYKPLEGIIKIIK